ncbi:MAG TPA: transcriptional regulator MntR, partial [Candidatus Nitrosocosmicus sp.]|nr:transcriptional regulator MntR [Candidatus Nitrosocosmicus sp.]
DRMEDYLEIIYELVQQKGYATSVDITECLNVSAPSVTKMMRRLDLKGYLEYEKYRGIRLTDQGRQVAENIKKRHKLLTEFFKLIGVSEDIANQDAEGIEHHLHAETLEKLEQFLSTVNEYRNL